jgi:hypothetical protein
MLYPPPKSMFQPVSNRSAEPAWENESLRLR